MEQAMQKVLMCAALAVSASVFADERRSPAPSGGTSVDLAVGASAGAKSEALGIGGAGGTGGQGGLGFGGGGGQGVGFGGNAAGGSVSSKAFALGLGGAVSQGTCFGHALGGLILITDSGCAMGRDFVNLMTVNETEAAFQRLCQSPEVWAADQRANKRCRNGAPTGAGLY